VAFRRLALLLALALVLPAMASSEPLHVVVLGDSLAAGLGVADQDAFPAKLQAKLVKEGLDVSIGNAGVSGDTAEDGLARLDWSVPDGTDAVLVELGANDMLRGTDPARAKAALGEILTRLSARRIAAMLLGMRAAPNLGPDYQKEFDRIYPALSAEHKVPLYPFFLEGVAGRPDLNQQDGMHPNPRGVDEIVTRVAPSVAAFLREIDKK
jgi:acyl-CoA thioesterase I